MVSDVFQEVSPQTCQEVVYDAVDLERFQPQPKSVDAPQRVGIIANLAPVKGHEVFLGMARLLVDRGMRPEFWLVGRDDGDGGRVRGLIESLQLTPHAKLLGFQSDIPAVLSNLDVVVSSSHMETFGLSVAEAMACAKPVVATRVGAMPEVIADGETGFLVPAQDSGAMADAVEHLLKNASICERMGQAARARAEQLFHRDVYARKILRLYEQVLQRN
jgi:glycosyltransferase involved in cell wall biosynthesis